MIKFKIDIVKELEKYGYDQTRIRKEKILSSQTFSNLKSGKGFSLDTLNKICIILRMQPGDILEIVPTNEEKIRFF